MQQLDEVSKCVNWHKIAAYTGNCMYHSYKHLFPCANEGKWSIYFSITWDYKLCTTASWKRLGSTSRIPSVVTHNFLIFPTLKYRSLVKTTHSSHFHNLYLYASKFRTKKKEFHISCITMSEQIWPWNLLPLNLFLLETCSHYIFCSLKSIQAKVPNMELS